MALHNPKLDTPLIFRTTDKLLIVGALLLVGYCFYYFLSHMKELPETIALQYGADGVPQRFGSRTEVMMVPGFLAGVVILLLLLSRVPQLYTYPCELTQENFRKVYTKGRELILVAAFFLAVLLNVILAEFIFAVELQQPFPFWVFLAVTVLLILIPASYLIRISRM